MLSERGKASFHGPGLRNGAQIELSRENNGAGAEQERDQDEQGNFHFEVAKPGTLLHRIAHTTIGLQAGLALEKAIRLEIESGSVLPERY